MYFVMALALYANAKGCARCWVMEVFLGRWQPKALFRNPVGKWARHRFGNCIGKKFVPMARHRCLASGTRVCE
jgi:hypothetical protein